MLTYWPPMMLASYWAFLPDLINGIFEFCGGFFILLSVRKLHRDKLVKGVSWVHVSFFSAWGFWNLFYYPHLDQWLSFYGGLWIVAVNCIWLGQIIYYRQREKRAAFAEAMRASDLFIENDTAPLTISAKGLGTPPASLEPVKLFRHSDK